jgi:hypothetical protein
MQARQQAHGVRAPSRAPDALDGSCDVLFVVFELSDAMRRGVVYFSVRGRRLGDLDDVLSALIRDGEIAYDDTVASEVVGH